MIMDELFEVKDELQLILLTVVKNCLSVGFRNGRASFLFPTQFSTKLKV